MQVHHLGRKKNKIQKRNRLMLDVPFQANANRLKLENKKVAHNTSHRIRLPGETYSKKVK